MASDPWIRWSWIGPHLGLVGSELAQHIELTAVAVGLGLVIALPLSWAAWHWSWLTGPVLGVSGLLYTIPSLALFSLLLPIFGLSAVTAEFGLVGYTLLILIRNTITGLASVPPEVREAARAMGYSSSRALWKIDFPLALPAIVAGLRIATVTTIGLVSVTALIGEGGLGQLFIDAFQRDFHTPLVVGLILSVTLALLADVALLGLGRVLAPWSRRVGTNG